jgi:hypothetical protein
VTLRDVSSVPEAEVVRSTRAAIAWHARARISGLLIRTLATAEMTDPAAILIYPAASPLAPTRCGVPLPNPLGICAKIHVD